MSRRHLGRGRGGRFAASRDQLDQQAAATRATIALVVLPALAPGPAPTAADVALADEILADPEFTPVLEAFGAVPVKELLTRAATELRLGGTLRTQTTWEDPSLSGHDSFATNE